MLKKIYLLAIGLMIMSTDLFATHYMGGEITWECLSNGNYRFIMKAYRECAGITYPDPTLQIRTSPSIVTITMTLVSKTDISPNCYDPAQEVKCDPKPSASNTGAVEEWLYTSDAVYPSGVNLTGIPPAQGWTFYYDSGDRNNGIINLNPQYQTFRLRAVMYPYNNTNAYPCFDNSPKFEESPAIVLAMGYPFIYNQLASDKELDSLAYKWGQPLRSGGAPVTYASGYSITSPLPGPAQDSRNVAATLNPYTGELAFECYNPQGAYVTVVKVEAWRCGIKVAEIFRDLQVVLLAPQPGNKPPVVRAPFVDPATGLYTSYSDTVDAGELVQFSIQGTDVEYLPTTPPTPQTIGITATGIQFGTNYTSTTTGCQNPPCATLNPPPPLSGLFALATNFEWQTTCDHLATFSACGKKTSVYNFSFRVFDNYCAIPAISFRTVTIVVKQPTLDPPSLRCVRVNNNGDVSLSWNPIVDVSNSFHSYQIFSSNSLTGPFTVIDSITDVNIDSYTHIGANANNQTVYYYLRTKSGCPGYEILSTPSDTLQTILLSAVNTGAGAASLTWNTVRTPLLPSSSGSYIIYREHPAGTWAVLDTTDVLSYIDSINLCSAFINYRVELYDSSGCWSVSSVDGDLFQDAIAPPVASLDSVSVDHGTQQSVLSWDENTSGDTEGYYIFHFNGTIWEKIDSVYGIGNTSYMDVINDPTTGSQSYRVAAFDSCGNTSPMGLDHQTIYLQGVLDVCANAITLSWNPYKNMDSAVAGYRIWMSENGSPFAVLASNPATADSYEHYGLNDGSQYCYFVQAFNTDSTITSSSNELCFLVVKPRQPQFAYLKYATVRNNSFVELYGYVDTAAYVSRYKIYRSESALGPWQLLGTLPQDTIPFLSYRDLTARVQEQSYFYRVDVEDSCGADVLTSNIARSILLRATVNEDFTNTLTWNGYEDWLGGVSFYNIYRAVDGIFNPAPLATVGSGITSYVDDLMGLAQSGGQFRYFVKAFEGPGNPYMFLDSAYSNETEALQPPRLYVPNAFTPKGYNNSFAPVGVFMSSEDYYFAVFNRWGAVVFESRIPGQGWNGKYKGDYAQSGVYIYYVRFKTATGKLFEKRGSVSLIY